MSAAKVAVTMERDLLKQLDGLVQRGAFSSRSNAVQEAVRAVISRWEKRRLFQETAKLNPREERGIADEALEGDTEWPEY